MTDAAPTATHAKETARQQQPAAPVLEAPVAQFEEGLPLALSVQRATVDPGRLRPADVLALQRAAGNRAVTGLIQAKLTVGPVGDRYEQEADRVAGQVMQMGESANAQVGAQPGPGMQRQEDEEEVQAKPLAATIAPLVQRQEDEEELQMAPALQRQEDEEEIQTKPAAQSPISNLQPRADGSFEAGADLESRLAARKGGGHPLPDETRAFMEPRFGADFGGVRVHTGGESAKLNEELQARAFTHGQDIYLGAGAEAPGSEAGNRLLAHELTHVIQQDGSRAPSSSGQPAARLTTAQPSTVQRVILSVDQVITGLRQIETFRQRLEGNVGLVDAFPETRFTTTARGTDEYTKVEEQEQRLSENKLRQGPTLREHIESLLQSFEAHFQAGRSSTTANAMKLVAALTTVGKAMARALHAPYEQSKISAEILRVFKDQLQHELKGGRRGNREISEQSLTLASALASEDPIGLYMQNKIPLDGAMQLIGDVADRAGRRPSWTFRRLNEQFQMEMGSYTLEDVQRGERPALQFGEGIFETKNLYGEISEEYFQSLLQLDHDGRPQWEGGGLLLQPAAQTKLDKLKEEAIKWDTDRPGGGGDLDVPAGLTRQQARYLTTLSTRENVPEQTNAATDRLRAVFRPELGNTVKKPGRLKRYIARKDADKKIAACLKAMNSAIWGIQFKPVDIFGDADNIPDQYGHYFSVFAEEVGLNALITGSGEHITRTRPSETRGPDYGTWRYEKDIKATGQARIDAVDLPKYGALHFVQDPSEIQASGVYGDYAFILKKENFRDRVVFSYGTNAERKNPLLVLGDMAKDEKGQNMLRNLVSGRLAGTELEFHIFGAISFRTDLRAIACPRGVKTTDVEHTVQLQQNEMTKVFDAARKRGEDTDLAINQHLQAKQDAVTNMANAARDWDVPVLSA